MSFRRHQPTRHRHTWRRRVTAARTVPTTETGMWGNTVTSTYVRCHAEYVCDQCGAVREEGNCMCDTSRAEHCAVRLDWLAGNPAPAGEERR